ncbi:gamma-glutamyl-gamma-aminobutyrate hydrolase family protein [Fusobacterium mortiferum]|uniref:gamma-glutamyl-gamma-aminobutyrate hydrolase family protein n=1 Tax=Fusobacterium mortiferum TaxID=850 RepID=UPI0019565216|nr:gamma-glutamyl-gamma-aminobutyrate hydrolase family protein [Fusobacterium mortiferum]
MKKPVIGITSAWENDPNLKNYFRNCVSIDYSKSIIAAGGTPIIIPTLDDLDTIKEQVKLLDGLILSGGADVNPLLYGEEFKNGIGVVSLERDRGEMLFLEEFIKSGKPILGICRGHQLLNVFMGGTLFQDLKYTNTEVVKHRQDFYPDMPVHKVKIIDKDNILADLFGEEIFTNSFHHQAVNKIGKDLTPIAVASDGIIEAFQMKNHKFFYGIQWHPEMMTARGNTDMLKIFEKFVEKAAAK